MNQLLDVLYRDMAPGLHRLSLGIVSLGHCRGRVHLSNANVVYSVSHFGRLFNFYPGAGWM
jgi:hypothetical protein